MTIRKGKSSAKTSSLGALVSFVRTSRFWKNLLYIVIFFLLVFLATYFWLKHYTHHGQQIDLPDYVGYTYEDAVLDAKERSFRLSIIDSIHIVGKQGHEILNQNPPATSKVKENRNIYVTVTKMNPDQITLSRLPVLYGKNYDRKKRELLSSFEIKSRIIGRKYDPGEPDHILMVVYEGDTIIDSRTRKNNILIEKGSTLEFIISKRTGGAFQIPDLVCMTYAEIKFLLNNLGLNVNEVLHDGEITDPESAYVSSQSPTPPEGIITMGEGISVSISQEKPGICN
jgi:beta-lactam-binding protein with PASTA domain